ncbi:hypothetical protein LXA43DRAFT_425051 [Ganoderma leucocontextum]|nr:hypothetical protein LXA43DRAFT_425051 [Ganoderma leucocontextum]
MSHRTSAPGPQGFSLSVFVHGDHVYTSPTRLQFPPRGPPPSYDHPALTGAPSSSTWLHCMWGKRDYLELAFYPISTRPLGAIFQSLCFYRQDMIPLQTYQPHPNASLQYRSPHADEWTKLEATLVQVRNLLQNHRYTPVLVSLDKEPVPGPWSEAYTNWMTDREAAQRKAYYARRKFMYHIAIISFHIAALWHRTGDPHCWYDYLLQSGVEGHILDSLSASAVADFTLANPRAGLFVNPNECPWVTYLPVLITAQVPVFIFWGPMRSLIRAPPGFEKLQPSALDVSAAQRMSTKSSLSSGQLSGPSGHSIDAPSTSVTTSSSGAAGRPPQFLPTNSSLSSGQLSDPSGRSIDAPSTSATTSSSGAARRPPRFLPTNTPGQFFAARAVYRTAYIRDVETEEQRVARLSREKHAANYQISQKGGDELFEWDFDYEGMRWKRERITRKDRENVWSGYDFTCKRYDPVTREWDVAYFLDYANPQPSVEDEYNRLLAGAHEDMDRRPSDPFFHEGDYQLAPPPPPDAQFSDNETFEMPMHGEVLQVGGVEAMTPTLMTSTPVASTTIASATTTARTPAATTTATNSATPTNLEDGQIMALEEREWHPRFPTLNGVIMSRHLFRWGTSDLPAAKHLTLDDACKAVGFVVTSEIRGILDNDKKATAFAQWVSCIVHDMTPPADWWLLEPKTPFKLLELLRTSNLRVFTMDDAYQHVRLWGLDDRRNSRYKRTWFIAVDNPSTALEAALSARSVDEVARWMVTFGIQFRTLVYSPRVTSLVKQGLTRTMADSNVYHRLMMRPTNYQFKALDFFAYEEVRDHFLRANPRIGRASLLAGGILWRLTIESLVPDLVLDGPGDLAYARGIGFALRDSADDIFVDDQVTIDEVRIIVGTYIREPTQLNNAAGAGLPMWWPDFGHFEGSALDCGWWSPVAEDWYCALREQYRSGTSQPKTGSQWRSVLRNRDKRTRLFTKNSMAAAKAFLGGIST